nr:regulatory iron-sulfur-containing complex subunit RicT [Butyrivibrio sp. AE3004]
MTRVIGVRFRTAGKIYYFDPGNFDIKKGDHVIVETARGVEYGTVLSDPRDVDDEEVTKPLKAVLRMANEKDDEQEKSNRIREKEAFKICKEKIIKHGLEMKLIDAEYTFDNNKVLFYFTADGRIDFRDLVKDLASEFKTRIELRQIGVRDETKIIGGYGICGRPLCCHSYLSDFIPVSIKMAKEQNLSLNPTKISGVCGRLMCCLKNEEDVYEELNRKMPGVGDIVHTNDDLEGEVASVNILRQTVRILVDVDDEKEVHEYNVDDLTLVRKRQKHKQNAPKEKDADEEAAKALEQQDKDISMPERPAKNKNQNRQNKQNNNQNNNQNKNNQNKNNQNNKQYSEDKVAADQEDKNQNSRTENESGLKNNQSFAQDKEQSTGQNNKPSDQDKNQGTRQNNKFSDQDKNQAAGQNNVPDEDRIQSVGYSDNQSSNTKDKQTIVQNAGLTDDQANSHTEEQDNKKTEGQNSNQSSGQNGNQSKGQKNFERRNNKKKNFNRNRNNKNQDKKGQDRRNQDNRNKKQNRNEGANEQG